MRRPNHTFLARRPTSTTCCLSGGGGGGLVRTVSIVLLLAAVTWLPLESLWLRRRPTQGTVTSKRSTTTSSTTSSSTTPSRTIPSAFHNATIHGTNDPSFVYNPPWQVWQAYLQQHGVEALTRETTARQFNTTTATTSDRQFLVAPYWCPDRAGNVLHNLWNSVSWAVLLNRTLLLRWVNDNPPGNTRAQCQAVLSLHPQVAVWDDWHVAYDLNDDDVFSIPLQANRIHFDERLTAVMVPQIRDIYHRDEHQSSYYRNEWDDHPLASYRPYLQAWFARRPDRQHLAFAMLGWGVPYWYGLLLRHVFGWPAAVPQVVTQGGQQQPPVVVAPAAAAPTRTTTTTSTISIAVHSRHIAHADDGSYVPEETQCLAHLLQNVTASSTTNNINCTVTIMADRRATLVALSEYLHTNYPTCRVVTTRHDEQQDTKRIVEHGPFAGTGFLHDLVTATSALPVTALVGDLQRSSFHLLYEWVVYENHRLQHATPQTHPLGDTILDVPVCRLTPRGPAGYSYGPGTPTFVRNVHKFPPLAPVAVLQEYMAQEAPTSYLVVPRVCATDDSYASFLAALVVAILSQRQLVWTGNATNCNDVLPDWLPAMEQTTIYQEFGGKEIDLDKVMQLTQPGAEEQELVTLSTNALAHMVTTFRQGNLLRPNQGGGRRPVAKALFTYGPEFLMGFLAAQIWDTNATLVPRQVPTLTAPWTVGMDVRHLESPNSDNVVMLAETCLRQTMENQTDTEACQIVLVQETNQSYSDLPQLLQSQFQCSVVTVDTSADMERALAVVGQVRQGWITANVENPDAKSQRMRERIEWERIHSTWRLGRFPVQVPSFVDCTVNVNNDS